LIISIWLFIAYKDYITVPNKRLELDEYYSDMPPDEKHIYIEMPIDHNNPDWEISKGFTF
jgi:hypothetical protein